MSESTLPSGRIVKVAGPVVDVEFPPDALARDQLRPRGRSDHRQGHDARSSARSLSSSVTTWSVQSRWPRPMDSCAAPRCATPVRPIMVPVGDQTLGHIFNAWGVALDAPDHVFTGPNGGRSTVNHPRSTRSSRRRRSSRPASRSSISSARTSRAARSDCSVVPVSARRCSSRR